VNRLTRNVVSGCAQNLAARPKRMLLAPDQLSCAPTSTLSLSFWNMEPENSLPSFLHVHTRQSINSSQVAY